MFGLDKNIQTVCSCCAEKHFTPVNWDGIDRESVTFVKAPFPVKAGKSEWMWVKVTSFKDGHFHGALDNHPTQDVDVAYGDEVTVPEEDVIDVVTKT